MLGRRASAGWIAAALVAGAIWSLLPRAERSRAVRPGEEEPSGPSAVLAEPMAVPGVARGRFLPVGPGPEPAAPDPVAAAEEPLPGRLEGALFDDRGRPLVGHRLVFAQKEGVRGKARLRAISDETGCYEIDKVPPGRWFASYAGSQISILPIGLVAGEVDVAPGEVVLFDYYRPGTRRLEAAFVHADDPRILLTIEVRRMEDRDVVVARGVLSSTDPVERRPPDELEPDRPPPIPGRFFLEGLEPGLYAIRVIAGKNAETGNQVYVEREADLTNEDASLPPESISGRQFYEESIPRWAGSRTG